MCVCQEESPSSSSVFEATNAIETLGHGMKPFLIHFGFPFQHTLPLTRLTTCDHQFRPAFLETLKQGRDMFFRDSPRLLALTVPENVHNFLKELKKKWTTETISLKTNVYKNCLYLFMYIGPVCSWGFFENVWVCSDSIEYKEHDSWYDQWKMYKTHLTQPGTKLSNRQEKQDVTTAENLCLPPATATLEQIWKISPPSIRVFTPSSTVSYPLPPLLQP